MNMRVRGIGVWLEIALLHFYFLAATQVRAAEAPIPARRL